MRSKIYECHVMHARFHPKAHRFVYRLFMLSVDLDELPTLDRRLNLFSLNRANLYSLRERDFLPLNDAVHNPSVCNHNGYKIESGATLKERVLAYLTHHGVEVGTDARVELITLPRMLGYRFNPVSFYFIRDANGEPLAAITEVTNTFHEMKPYLLSGDTRTADGFRQRVPKEFYVSPFSDVDLAFDFRLRVPQDRLAVQIDDYDGTPVLSPAH